MRHGPLATHLSAFPVTVAAGDMAMANILTPCWTLAGPRSRWLLPDVQVGVVLDMVMVTTAEGAYPQCTSVIDS